MATKALNYPTAEINQRLNLAGTAVQPDALNDYYTKSDVNNIVGVDLSGKKVAFIGDSITQGVGTDSSHVYHKVFADLARCTNINLGVSGDGIGLKTTNSPRFKSRATVSNLSGTSLIVVFGGTNDFKNDAQAIGELFADDGSTISAPANTDAFGGALHELINTIRTNAPLVPIVFITPINRGNSQSQLRSDQYNSRGEKLQDFCDAIDKVCEFYSIPVFHAHLIPQLDFSNSSIALQYSADGLHPNNAGHAVIGKALYQFVKNNIII